MSPNHAPTAGTAGSATPLPAATELRGGRRRITNALLGGLTVLGGVAYLPSVWAAVEIGVWSIVVMDTAVYATVVFAFIRRDLDDGLRGGAAVGAAALLGLTLSVVFGPNGAGALWICAVPVLTALLFDRRATIWSLVFVAVALGAVAALRWADLVAWEQTPGGTLLWLLIAGNAILIAGALALAVSALIAGLTEAADRTERYGAALMREQEDLLEANALLEQAIRERARAEGRLRQAEKLTAIGTLASGIAHDMNNLLVPILAGTELLRADARDLGEARTEVLERTHTAATAARDLVQRILAFTRPASEDRTPLVATTVFREAARLLQASLPQEVELVFRGDPEAGAIVLSIAEAHQLVLNLGTNAAQAMPEGGRLTLTVDAVRASGGPPAGVPVPESGRFVRLMVTDEGVGMDEETLSRVFEPFFTRRERASGGAQGHGIGLAAVHGTVSSAGGFIVPHSQPGAGTVMEVFLPRTRTSARTEEAAPEIASAGRGEGVLLVDDDEDVRFMGTRILERAGYNVVAADGAEAAVREIRSGASVDVVVTDLAMPDMDGLALAETLRAERPTLPVILMSGLIDDDVRLRASALDVRGVLLKPFGATDLPAIVASALGLSRTGSRDGAGRP